MISQFCQVAKFVNMKLIFMILILHIAVFRLDDVLYLPTILIFGEPSFMEILKILIYIRTCS